MIMKPERRQPVDPKHHGESRVNVGILAPSKCLFKKLDEEVSLEALKRDVISSIQNRESLIDRARLILSDRREQIGAKRCRKGQDVNSNQIKKLMFALHNASLCVVEAIISFDLASQSVKCGEENGSASVQGPYLMPFVWMGENYLTKMLIDFQFMCSMNEIMEILLPERKTLFRNPFLLPLDLDEIVGFEPNSSCVTAKSKSTRMSRVTWNLNIERIKRAASRILFEEHRAVYGDKKVVHVFPKTLNTKKSDKNLVEIHFLEDPAVDTFQLQQVIQSNDISFDDALVLACVRIFLSRDIETVQIEEDYISKEAVLKLAKQPLETITDELCIDSSASKRIFVEDRDLYTIYVMMMRNEIKLELLNVPQIDSLKRLKAWLLSMIRNQWNPFHFKINKVNSERNKHSRQIRNNEYVDPPTEKAGKVGKENEDPLQNLDTNECDQNKCEGNVQPNQVIKSSDDSPVPIWRHLVVKEGSSKAVFVQSVVSDKLNIGDNIRLGHPFHSYDYIIVGMGSGFVNLNAPYKTFPPTREEILGKSAERLYSPKKEYQTPNVKANKMLPEDDQKSISVFMAKKIGRSGMNVRIWKLISCKDDKRLQWRIDFDHGLVPWFPLPLSRYGQHFRVKIDMKEIEGNCFDVTHDPEISPHQQRLEYFEKVPLDDIIDETFNTVSQSWHPTTPSIDNVKWAKLARTMKFLSNVKNANHEVDMAFFRHSHQRKLNPRSFKSVLLDMALHKYSSARYDGGEALANLLWTTVVTLPQVNRMIWTKAQMMAVKVELRRTCAQVRVAARFRMWYQRKVYHHILAAVTCISKNVRRMIARKKKMFAIEQAEFHRFYRLRYYSAIVCQKYWRRFICVTKYYERKRLMKKRKEIEVSNMWKELRRRGMERTKNLVFREVVNVQSVLTITSMFLKDKMLESGSIELEIKVYVPGSKSTFTFKLSENDVRESLEKFILRRGPLSWNEILKKDILMRLKDRLMAKVVRGKPIITFCRRDIAEKGNLISRQLFASGRDLYIISFYRSPYDIVIRLYHPESTEQLRTMIDMSLLIEWLIEDEAIRKKEALGMLRIRDIAQGKNRSKTHEDVLSKRRERFELPILLRREKQDSLVNWLKTRIHIIVDESDGKKKIILQYQADAEYMERIAKKFQSMWRANCARKRARKEVYKQYEKQFDWESKTFYYVHLKTGTRQWTKPALLRDDEDINDPPDEWREMEYVNDETGETRIYYMNPLTGQTSWLSQHEAAQIVQRKFRQRQTELLLPSFRDFSQIVRAVTMIRDTEMKYQQQPSKLSNRVNYALLCHCLRFDINTARSLYKEAIIKSTQHPVIARAYGIFILATCQAPLTQTFEKACQLFEQAQTIDPDQKLFQIAIDNFFYWAVVMNPNNGMALLNYALLHQCILGEFYRAEKIYIRALTQDPNNECIAQNFKLFEDQRYPGGYYEGSGVPNIVVKRSNVFQESKEWGEWKKMIDPLSSKPKFNTFWLNVLDKTTSFKEPDWKVVWLKRVQRSKRITSNMKALWVEYYDEQLHATFIHNRSSGQFVWQQS